MTNNTLKRPRKSFEEIVNNNTTNLHIPLNKALQSHRAMLERFFSNVEYLRTQRGESCYRMLRNLYTLSGGFLIDDAYYSMLKRGKSRICSFQILAVLSAYFEMDMLDLMIKDIKVVNP